MSKFTDQLADALGVCNAWEFAGKGNPFISYSPNDYGRGGRSAHFTVIRPGYRTDPDPNAHWQDYGNKTFMVWGSGKEAKDKMLAEALEWAGARYKITEWAKTPFGTWMSAEFVKTRLAELKAQLKAKEKIS